MKNVNIKYLIVGISSLLILNSSIQAEPPKSEEPSTLDSTTERIFNKAKAMLEIAEDEVAIQYLKEQVLEHPTNYSLKAYLAITYKSLGQNRKAMKSLERLSRTHVNTRLDSAFLRSVRYHFGDLINDSVQTLKVKSLQELSDDSVLNAIRLANLMIEIARRNYFFTDHSLNEFQDRLWLYSYRKSAVTSFNEGIAMRAFAKWLAEPIDHLVNLDLETDAMEVEMTYRLKFVEYPYRILVSIVSNFVTENGLNESCADKMKYFELIRQSALLSKQGSYYWLNSLNKYDTTSISDRINDAYILAYVYSGMIRCYFMHADPILDMRANLEMMKSLMIEFEETYPSMLIFVDDLDYYQGVKELLFSDSSSTN